MRTHYQDGLPLKVYLIHIHHQFSPARAFVKADIAENREGFVKVTFSLSYKFLPMIYEFCIIRYYGSITAVNKIFLHNYLFFWLKYNIINHKSKEQTSSYNNCSVALRAPERRVARSASPDLSDRALIRAAEQNRSSRSPSDLASKLASPPSNRSTRR